MLSTKKLIYKILMAVSTIKNRKPIVRTVATTYSITAGGTWSTPVKNLIDADMPSGYYCGGIVGFSTNDQHCFVVSARYGEGAYALQLGSTATVSNKTISVYYLAIPELITKGATMSYIITFLVGSFVGMMLTCIVVSGKK